MPVSAIEIHELITWWASRESADTSPLRFSDAFEYVTLGTAMSLGALVDFRASTTPVERLRVHTIVAEDARAGALFDAFDPVTGLTYRIAWFIEHRDDQLEQLVAVRETLPPD